jgi:hypothetical protein
MPAVWDGDLDARLPARPASRGLVHEASASGPRQPSTANRLAVRADAATPPPGIPTQVGQDPPRPSWPSSPARNHPQQRESNPVADSESSSALPPDAPSAAQRDRQGTITRDAGASVQAAASDPPRWSAFDPGASGQNAWLREQTWPEPGTGQPPNGKQRQPGTAAGTEPVTDRNPQRSAAPDADWRDQILRQSRQPGPPGPSWPHSPALDHAPELSGPDAGPELGR